MKRDATSGSRDDLQIEGATRRSVNIGIHDDQTFDHSPVGEHGSVHTPVPVDAFDAPDNIQHKAPRQTFSHITVVRASIWSMAGVHVSHHSTTTHTIIDSVKTLHGIDVDLSLYMPINIDIAVNSSTHQYTASMGGR